MTKTRDKRVAVLSAQICAMPIPRAAEDAAYKRFCETGELPEYQRLAAAVVQRAQRGGKVLEPIPDPIAYLRNIGDILSHRTGAHQKVPRLKFLPIREHLFKEAVYGTGIVRHAARTALKTEVSAGGDINDREFLEDRALPQCGSVGLHLLGFPERLAKPPNVKQARRLFARCEALGKHIDQGDPAWFQPIQAAVRTNRENGELPHEPLLRDIVLANAELEALWEHARGRDVDGLMAVLDPAASLEQLLAKWAPERCGAPVRTDDEAAKMSVADRAARVREIIEAARARARANRGKRRRGA